MAAIPRHWRGAFPAWGPLGSTLLWRRLRPGVCVVVSLVLGASQPVEGAQTPSRALVDSVFGEFDDQTPGAAIAVVHDARLVFAAGYGMANLDHDVPVGPETVFDIASVSKQFTGMAVSMLVEAGRIDLDAEARRYLPELPDFGDPLTVRHLVHHTSGIRDWPATLGVAGWRMDDVISFPQILRMAWNQRELNFPPGSEYSYSNTGYNLLAEIVSRVTGESFRAWTDQNIFRPLGMTSTHFQDDHREIVLRRAQGYTRVRGEWMVAPNGLTAWGSSSLHSSVLDLARWLINYDTQEIGGRSVIERMHTRGVLTSGNAIAYAYGISSGTYRGQPTWSHSGSWAGNRTYVLHFPELRGGVVVLSNSGAFDAGGRAVQLADLFFEDALGPKQQASSDAGDVRQPTPATQPVPEPAEDELREYAGTWASEELDTRYVLSVVEGRLVAEHGRHGMIRLTPQARDVFSSDNRFFQPVRFERDAENALAYMLVGEGRARNLRFERAR